jgi:hypothetical protein
MRENLRAPPWKTVLQWGRQLRMDLTDIQTVSERLSLRHALGKKKKLSFVVLKKNQSRLKRIIPGPDPGQLSNSRMWKKTTPASFRSPFFAQGDIGNAIPLPLLFF